MVPPAAFALVGVFIVVSVAAGVTAWWRIGPRRRLLVVAPVLGAFLALYVVGHRLSFGLGPTVRLFGFDVTLAWDIAVAFIAAFGTAVLQRRGVARRRRRRTGVGSAR